MPYTANGEKLSKAGTGGATKNYVSGIEYSGANLDAIYFSEDRCTPNGASAFYYEYTLKDHLGNARVNFRANGTAATFLQELHYYPFGMLMEGIGTAPVTNNGYKYNGKELNEDLGLNLSDYGARWNDAAVGRWWSVDPMGEEFCVWSLYNYGINNPIRMIDPDGKRVDNIIINENTLSASGALVTTRYEYKSDSKGNYGFIDPATGGIYSGTNTYITQTGNALNTLRSQPVGKALVDRLIIDPTDIEIANRSRNAADEAMGSFVLWNAIGTTSAPDESGSSNRPPYIGLAHELAHVEDVKNGTINRGTWQTIATPAGTLKDISKSEIYATHKENLIRKEHDLKLRKYYATDASGAGDKSTQIVRKGHSLYYNSSGFTTFNKVKKKDQFKY